MVTLGTFTKSGEAFQGSIVYRGVLTRIDIVPVGEGVAVAGMYRVHAASAAIGSAWLARDKKGATFLSVRLAATGQAGPVTCRLLLDREGFHPLVGPG